MKRAIAILCTILVIITLSTIISCKKSGGSEEKKEIVVFAAASLKESLEEIGKDYESLNSNVKVIYNFDSSGTLLKQIKNGADVDIFISASIKQMQDLYTNNYLDNPTMVDLLQNEVVLAVKDNEKNIQSFSDLKNHLEKGDILLAIGNSDVPVGQYTAKIFKYFSLDEEQLGNNGLLTYGTNVKEVTTAVNEGLADAGIIYSTDAFSAGLTKVDSATKEMCGDVIYPIGILKAAPNRTEADKFYEFLKTDRAKKEFEKVGFFPLV